MSFFPTNQKMEECQRPDMHADLQARSRDVDHIAAQMLVPKLIPVNCWRCRARALADTIEACVRLAMELPAEHRRAFEIDVASMVDFEHRKTSAAKAIAEDLITQARSTT